MNEEQIELWNRWVDSVKGGDYDDKVNAIEEAQDLLEGWLDALDNEEEEDDASEEE